MVEDRRMSLLARGPSFFWRPGEDLLLHPAPKSGDPAGSPNIDTHGNVCFVTEVEDGPSARAYPVGDREGAP